LPLRIIKSLNPFQSFDGTVIANDEEEEGGQYLFNPEAGRASDNPFAHLQEDESPKSADSATRVSKYVGGEDE
jgi:hypothetical protein